MPAPDAHRPNTTAGQPKLRHVYVNALDVDNTHKIDVSDILLCSNLMIDTLIDNADDKEYRFPFFFHTHLDVLTPVRRQAKRIAQEPVGLVAA